MLTVQTASRFRNLGTITIFAVYFLILVGSIVRASGSGLGCPDWPTCFGHWIPPTDESQLPANYHEIYAQRGYHDTQFNPVKTWIEYLNRLVGVSIGLLIFATAYTSKAYIKTDRGVFYLALSAFFLVAFQGWLGASVVASNLKPLVITLHMVVALVIVMILIYAVIRSQRDFIQPIDITALHGKFKTVLTIALAMTLLQIVMGTQIRETVDVLAHPETKNLIDRSLWRENFPLIFYVHRSFSSIILFTNAWLVWQLHLAFKGRVNFLMTVGMVLMGFIITAILAGVSLDRLGMPAIAQPVHLLMASLIFGTQFFLYVVLAYFSEAKLTNNND